MLWCKPLTAIYLNFHLAKRKHKFSMSEAISLKENHFMSMRLVLG